MNVIVTIHVLKHKRFTTPYKMPWIYVSYLSLQIWIQSAWKLKQ